ncbi:hypothetical protein WR25_03261 [Diploscapter pachys]|uniref:Uncharacterized protein n=1 Tax=Diploscapter pachys TaxID=2018661 RepID=A0A2A2JQ55_9BILA|nr:hypothetical protein WR25_03261 [Diploscapter pachys]
MAVASLFVVQSLSSLLPSAYFPQRMSSFNPRSLLEWFVQLRPQINIKPQLRVVTSSSHTSCNSSVAATMSRESDELNDSNEKQLTKSAQKAKNYAEVGLEVMQAIASDSREKWSNNDFESAAENVDSATQNDKSGSEA